MRNRASPSAIAIPGEVRIFFKDYAYLDGSGSYDPQGYALVEYSWKCGDGTTYTETSASAPDGVFDGETEHQYTYSYVFSVTLTVENSEEGTDTDVQSVEVASRLDPPSGIDASTVDLSWQNANHSASRPARQPDFQGAARPYGGCRRYASSRREPVTPWGKAHPFPQTP